MPHAEKVSRRFCPHHPLERGVAATLCRPVFARTERSARLPLRTLPRRIRGSIFYCVGWMPRATPTPSPRPVGVPTTAFSGLQPSKTVLLRAACPQFGRTAAHEAAVPQVVPSRCTPLASKRRLRGTDRANSRVIRGSVRRTTVFFVPRAKNLHYLASDQPFCRSANYIAVVRQLLCPHCGGHSGPDLMDSPPLFTDTPLTTYSPHQHRVDHSPDYFDPPKLGRARTPFSPRPSPRPRIGARSNED